jgi:N-acetylglucosaminyldiphosphoundecaprenol N-acetyl-beta-D-mannosaminyltransferase
VGVNVAERIPGVDIAEQLFHFGNELKKSIYLLGAKPEVIDALVKRLNKDFPDLNIVGAVNGYVDDKDAVFQEIIAAKPDIVLVALGMPAQERLIYKHLSSFEKGIFVGVGGSFDVMAGNVKRAPDIYIKLGLEWFYRLVKEPKRIGRMAKLPLFLLDVIVKKGKDK